MDTHFCKFYQGDGLPPSNRYCRNCNKADLACNNLWQLVVDLSNSNGGGSIDLPNTNAIMFPNRKNWDLVHLKINSQWNLSKEDFLHFIGTGRALLGRANQRTDPITSPSLTRQEPYVQSIIELLGGMNIPEIIAVKDVQKFGK